MIRTTPAPAAQAAKISADAVPMIGSPNLSSSGALIVSKSLTTEQICNYLYTITKKRITHLRNIAYMI
jgi:hypothetical protein